MSDVHFKQLDFSTLIKTETLVQIRSDLLRNSFRTLRCCHHQRDLRWRTALQFNRMALKQVPILNYRMCFISNPFIKVVDVPVLCGSVGLNCLMFHPEVVPQ